MQLARAPLGHVLRSITLVVTIVACQAPASNTRGDAHDPSVRDHVRLAATQRGDLLVDGTLTLQPSDDKALVVKSGKFYLGDSVLMNADASILSLGVGPNALAGLDNEFGDTAVGVNALPSG